MTPGCCPSTAPSQRPTTAPVQSAPKFLVEVPLDALATPSDRVRTDPELLDGLSLDYS